MPADRVIRVLNAALTQARTGLDYFADAQPSVQASHATEYGIEYKMRYFILADDATRAKAKDVIIASVLQHLNHGGITLSYPKSDTYNADMPAGQNNWPKPEELTTQLAKISIFQSLALDDLNFIAKKWKSISVKKNKTLVNQGDARYCKRNLSVYEKLNAFFSLT